MENEYQALIKVNTCSCCGYKVPQCVKLRGMPIYESEVVVDFDGLFAVQCPMCLQTGTVEGSKAAAVRSWNEEHDE